MMILLRFLTSKLGQAVGAVLVAAGLLLGAVRYGTTRERTRASEKALRASLKTQEDINEVRPSADRDSALDRLRKNGWTG